MRIYVASVVLAVLSMGLFAVAQETAANGSTPTAVLSAASATSPVPRLVRFAGVAKDADNKNMSGTVGITFLLYKDQQGGAPLWMETQNVQADSTGHYSVQLGATKPDGLPTDVFTSGEARWLAVQISGQAEQPRVLLLSVPYALKAADAETIGGLPPSAFMKAIPGADSAGQASEAVGTSQSGPTSGVQAQTLRSNASKTVSTASPYGTKGYIPIFTTANTIQNSSTIFQTGGNTGVGTITPRSFLEVAKTVDFGTGPILTLTNSTTDGVGGSAAIDFNAFNPVKNSNPYNATARILAYSDNYSADLQFLSNKPGAFNQGFQTNMIIQSAGNVGIATTTPAGALHINGPASAPPSSQPAANNGLVLGTNGTSSYKWMQSFGGPLALNPTSNDVGIGTTSPTHLLEVAGNADVDSTDLNNGTNGIDLTFGHSSGEGISSPRTTGSTNMFGLDFWTAGTLHMCIANNGNVGIGVCPASHPLQMGDGAYEQSGTWTNASDRNLKANFTPVNGRLLLAHLNKIPMSTWNYKTDDRSVRHLGPMAQDFYAAFGLDGKDEKHISTVDEGGVALAAVQELYRMVLKGDAQVASLARSNREKDVQIENLKAEVKQLHQLEQAVQVLSTKLSKIEAGENTSANLLRASK